MINDIGKQAYGALRHNRRRSMLTMLGMAWGIATVVLLLAYGSGFERGLMAAFTTFGGNLIAIFPGRTSLQAGGTKAGTQVQLTVKDLEALRAEVPFLKRSSPEANKQGLVAYGTRSISYQVIGILKKLLSNGEDNMNAMVYIPFSTMSDLRDTYYLNAIVLGYEGEHEKVAKAVRDSLAFHHSFDPKDKRAVFVFDSRENLKELSIITVGIKILLGFIGMLTLGIGGVGLMNIMLVSVTQRTREIGVEKALGARRWHILFQFLAEALAITAIGGLLGVALAYLVSATVGALRYTRRCSWVIRRDQQPASTYFSGSGFPIPVNGSRTTASTRSRTRKAIRLSFSTQSRKSSRN